MLAERNIGGRADSFVCHFVVSRPERSPAVRTSLVVFFAIWILLRSRERLLAGLRTDLAWIDETG